MAYNYRGRRVAYDNVAVGEAAGVERYNGETPSPSEFGSRETGGFSNIANAALPGIEDTENGTGDKLTTAGETVAD